MTQQVFADYIGQSPATLSSIFNGRTRPTLNIVKDIKEKIPNISTDWLMFGIGDMYLSDSDSQTASHVPENQESDGLFAGSSSQSTMLDFDAPSAPTPQKPLQQTPQINGVRNTRPDIERTEVKFIDKPQRRVIEIRVFYDDQTWEEFVPKRQNEKNNTK